MDAVDRRLLETLRAAGRTSFAELGRLVGRSAPSVTDRAGRLERAGIILGYHAVTDPAALGVGVAALIGVRREGRVAPLPDDAPSSSLGAHADGADGGTPAPAHPAAEGAA